MSLNDWVMILAILAGPLSAVQATRILDNKRENRGRKLNIYRTLMATRAEGLSGIHVQSLNSIDLEFTGRSSKERAVREAWAEYLDHLGVTDMAGDTWKVRRVELFVELMHKMGKCLGYEFDRVHIKNGVYSPRAHGELEEDQSRIREGLRELLEGTRFIPMYVVNLPDASTQKSDGASGEAEER